MFQEPVANMPMPIPAAAPPTVAFAQAPAPTMYSGQAFGQRGGMGGAFPAEPVAGAFPGSVGQPAMFQAAPMSVAPMAPPALAPAQYFHVMDQNRDGLVTVQ